MQVQPTRRRFLTTDCTRARLSTALTLMLALALAALAGSTAVADDPAQVTLLPPGTIASIEDSKQPRIPKWNRVILLARPRIASGDINALGTDIRNSIQSFVLTLMASVEKRTNANAGENEYFLADFGIGYSTPIGSDLTVVTPDSATDLGAELSFFQRQVLSTNQKQLKTARLVARTSTLTIFDTPAVLLRAAEHRSNTMRHFVWVDRRTGEVAMLVWLIEKDPSSVAGVVDEPIRWISANTKEDRKIHIDGSKFTFGIPSTDAFALESLPPGRDVEWIQLAAELAANPTYTRTSLEQLTKALTLALRNASKETAVAAGADGT